MLVCVLRVNGCKPGAVVQGVQITIILFFRMIVTHKTHQNSRPHSLSHSKTNRAMRAALRCGFNVEQQQNLTLRGI